MKRIQDLDEFWDHYLGEHADPTTRYLHFAGTTGFLAALAASLFFAPSTTALALAFSVLVVGLASRYVEARRAAFVPGALVAFALCGAAPSIMPFGILFAYLCAWVGHFNFEGNRPATFRYPIWSLICDFRMYALMCTGQLWTKQLSRGGSLESV